MRVVLRWWKVGHGGDFVGQYKQRYCKARPAVHRGRLFQWAESRPAIDQICLTSRQIGDPALPAPHVGLPATNSRIAAKQSASPAIISSPRASPRLLLIIIENASSRRLQEEEGPSAQTSKLLRLSTQSQVQKDRQNISFA